MKKVFTPETEKVTDKAFTHGLLVSVFSILLCIVALCSMTYAWFSAGISSGVNTLEGGRFALDVTVINNADGTDVVLTETENGGYKCTLAEGEYTVILKMTDDTTATKGFCDITVNLSDIIHTEPVSKDETVGHDPLTFTLKVTDESVSVTFVPKWGMSSADVTVGNGETVNIGAQPSTDEVE